MMKIAFVKNAILNLKTKKLKLFPNNTKMDKNQIKMLTMVT